MWILLFFPRKFQTQFRGLVFNFIALLLVGDLGFRLTKRGKEILKQREKHNLYSNSLGKAETYEVDEEGREDVCWGKEKKLEREHSKAFT